MPSRSPYYYRLLVYAAVSLAWCLASCQREAALPAPESEAYQEAVTAFYTSLAAMQAGEDLGAEENLHRVTALAPGEPAAWANLGVLALRRNELEAARERLERARALAPESSHIHMLLALLESSQGRFDEAAAYLRRALELDPNNLRAAFALAQELERQGDAASAAERQRLLGAMLSVQPDNMALLLERARLAALQEDRQALGQALERLAALAHSWPPEARQQLEALRQAASDADFRAAATQAVFLRNVLVSLPAFRQDLQALQAPADQVGEPMRRFLRLPSPNATPAPPDEALLFTAEPVSAPGPGPWSWAGVLWLTDDAEPTLALADERALWIDAQPAVPLPTPDPSGPALRVAPLDFNYDFRTDLAIAGPDGLRLYEQDSTGAFTDVTVRLNLPPSAPARSYTGAWAADVDLEGDLDLVLGAPSTPPLVLQNNGDGTFTARPGFEDVTGLQDFVWTDLDADGDPDAALLDADGRLHVYLNERLGQFRPLPAPQALGAVLALTAADVNGDGLLDLVILQDDGALLRLTLDPDGGTWHQAELARWSDLPQDAGPGSARLFAADLDNNGALDLLASAPGRTQLWLGDVQGVLYPLPDAPEAHVVSIADLDGDGRLDLLGFSSSGQPVRLMNRGTRDYHWQKLRLRAALAVGDQRVNAFGIGSMVEVRSGLLFQKQPVTAPVVHFGLGEHPQSDLVRIVWPNGDVQAEFSLRADETLLTPQRLKGSCPWLFTFDGEQMQFVTDFLWRSPLGLRINAQETAGVMTTQDWVRIRSDQLAAQDGFYDMRITAELWETHFFDHVSLMVVDHPAGTDVFVDERFAFPPPVLAVHATAPPQPVARAWDHRGLEATDLVQRLDARYLGTFTPGPYQGVAEDHYVEIELGHDAPEEGPLWLVASGWIRPTDSSINVALSQGRHAPPTGLSLEVPDGRGGWATARSGLGFPAGKTKTILIDLQDAFRPGAPRRLRLRTNLEIYWDALAWAVPQPEAALRTQRLQPETAELRYRGFSVVTAQDRSSPELPDYHTLAGTAPRWRDLTGYYTRFGDVRELLTEVDDRYVIMNAGDELRFRFPAPEGPPQGWKRTFVLVGDGWVKDGDYNTAFSKTVLPLPAHDQPAYTTPPGRLQDDPVYRRHPEDWQRYHTRYVTPERFVDALMSK